MDVLARDYEFVTDEYPAAYQFRLYLRNLHMCDYSEILDDIYYTTDYTGEPMIRCRRVIFFSCLPKDVERMTYILERLGRHAEILDSEGELLYG